jgi:hypothetical protein
MWLAVLLVDTQSLLVDTVALHDLEIWEGDEVEECTGEKVNVTPAVVFWSPLRVV